MRIPWTSPATAPPPPAVRRTAPPVFVREQAEYVEAVRRVDAPGRMVRPLHAIGAAVEALRADGVATDEIIDCSGIVEGFRVCFFDDPEGNRVEIMQGYEDEP